MSRCMIPPMRPDDIIDLEEVYVALELQMGPEKAATSPVLRIIRMANMMLETMEDVIPALKNLAHEMRFMLQTNPQKDGGLYRQRLSEAEAIIARAESISN